MPAKPPIKMNPTGKTNVFLSCISEETLFNVTMYIIAVALVATAIAIL